MPVNAVDDAGPSVLRTALRALGWTALLVGGALAFMFAFVAAMVVGLLIAGAAIALRFTPRPAAAGGPDILEARQTPAGWVVETDAKRKS